MSARAESHGEHSGFALAPARAMPVTTRDAPDSSADTLEAPSGVRAPSSHAHDIFAPNEIVSGIYEIRSRIGEGGMGQVFEAHDRALNRRVAIKAAWPHVEEGSIRKEAHALAALRHSSMVTVYGIGRHRDIDYMVMDRVHGESLDAFLARRRTMRAPLAIAEALPILVGIADGLAAVHAAGIAHRDVKPANVMLATGDRIVLMDFGIFRPEIESATGESVSGSPHYIAPETIENRIDAGAAFLVDVYAFGVLLYETLAGELPYDSDDVHQLLHMHRTAPVPDLAAKRPDAPARLCRLSRDLLAKDPKDRPQSMQLVRAELEACRYERATRTERLSVLIVEDEGATSTILRDLVASSAPNADIRCARDGETALAMVQAKVPHLLLLDINLPKMTGVELCMCLGAIPGIARCRIIVISSYTSPAEVELLKKLGASAFIAKGADLHERLPSLLADATG